MLWEQQRVVFGGSNDIVECSFDRHPRNKKELQSLIGKIIFLRRFYINSVGKVRDFSPLLKLKDSYEFVWHVEQQEVFDQIKDVANPPILMLSIQGRPLKLYISTAEESSGCLLAQDTKDDTERAVYYLSMLLNDVKTIYT